MRKRLTSIPMLTVLLIGTFSILFEVGEVKSSPTTWTVDDDGPADFISIQEAIDSPDVNSGDTIYVHNGIYYENVVVDKSVSLIGESRQAAIIDGNYFGTVVNTTIGDFDIINFTLRHSGPDSRDCGIYVDHVNDNRFVNNNIINCAIGIYLGYSNNNTVFRNTVSLNNHTGILLRWSNNNLIARNIVSNIRWYGIGLDDGCNNNIVTDNVVSSSAYGIGLDDSNNNTLTRNAFESNSWGIQIHGSSNNTVFHNGFIDNHSQATSSESFGNAWDNNYPSGGNYWSDYSERYPEATELNNLGIWDTPYVIDLNNQDNYPLMEPWSSLAILGDINGDRVVDIFDVVLVAKAFGSQPGDASWDQACDLNNDDVVDIFDIVLLANNFGKTA